MQPKLQRLENIHITKNWVKKLTRKKDYTLLLNTIISTLLVTRRTAKEYIDIAFFELGIKW